MTTIFVVLSVGPRDSLLTSTRFLSFHTRKKSFVLTHSVIPEIEYTDSANSILLQISVAKKAVSTIESFRNTIYEVGSSTRILCKIDYDENDNVKVLNKRDKKLGKKNEERENRKI